MGGSIREWGRGGRGQRGTVTHFSLPVSYKAKLFSEWQGTEVRQQTQSFGRRNSEV